MTPTAEVVLWSELTVTVGGLLFLLLARLVCRDWDASAATAIQDLGYVMLFVGLVALAVTYGLLVLVGQLPGPFNILYVLE